MLGQSSCRRVYNISTFSVLYNTSFLKISSPIYSCHLYSEFQVQINHNYYLSKNETNTKLKAQLWVQSF